MCQAEKGPELTAPAAPEASEPETELLAEAKAAGPVSYTHLTLPTT